MRKLISILSFTFLICNYIISQNGITGQSINLHATFHHLGVQVNFAGDIDNNATAQLEANINGGGFQTVHRLSRVANNRFVGTVFEVAPQTTVAVRVTLSDPSGVSNGVFTSSITTRSEHPPLSTGTTLHVSPTGNDNTGNGSAANPYKTIAHAVDLTNPGYTVLIHGGTYHEQVEVNYGQGGLPNAPITIKAAGDGAVILDGSDISFNNPSTWASEGGNIYSAPVTMTNYVAIDSLRLWRYDALVDLQNLRFNTDGGFFFDMQFHKVYIRLPGNASPTGHQINVSTLDYGFQLWNTPHIVIDGLTFRYYGSEVFSKAIAVSDTSQQVWIINNTFEGMATPIWLEGYVEDLVVMNNEFSDAGVTAFDWENLKEHQWWLERGSVFCSNDDYTGIGTIFYQNYVHDIFDGIKITGHDSLDYACNSDVEDNLFVFLADDGVETDGWSSNVRVVNNRFEHMLAGVSVAPSTGGPTYIIRNVMADLQNVANTDYETTAVKFNVDDEVSGEIFIYHNTATTFESNQAAISVTNDCDWEHVFMKNNIWQGTLYGFYYWLSNSLPFTQDYDLMHATSSDTIALYQGTEYFTVSDYFNATTLCAHCAKGDPLFVDINMGDYKLTASSPALDQAITIPGINDLYLGAGPDMGAFEFQSALAIGDPKEDELESQNLNIRIGPNPTSDILKIYAPTEDRLEQISIYNLNGQRVMQLDPASESVNVSQLASGIYILQAFYGSRSASKKFVKR